jgi:hypothetical protein
MTLGDTLQKHKVWLANEEGGKRANLRGTNLSVANLREADLRRADLSRADLRRADLRRANLIGADLSRADLSGANLYEANLSGANLSGANLSGANLSGADLSEADLIEANLSRADLRRADLSGANLIEANLIEADLSGATGLVEPAQWLKENFETDDKGIIVYKRIGKTNYNSPDTWVIEPGSFIAETVNPLPTLDCACGVNFGTREWCKRNYPQARLWRCRIWFQHPEDGDIDVAGIVVPYNTDGKARCGRLQLLEVVEND